MSARSAVSSPAPVSDAAERSSGQQTLAHAAAIAEVADSGMRPCVRCNLPRDLFPLTVEGPWCEDACRHDWEQRQGRVLDEAAEAERRADAMRKAARTMSEVQWVALQEALADGVGTLDAVESVYAEPVR